MTSEESNDEGKQLAISAEARIVLAKAIHLHERTGYYLVPDMVARASHDHFGCMTGDAGWETMDACEEVQDEIDTIMQAIVGMANVRAFEAREGHAAVREAARTVVGVD